MGNIEKAVQFMLDVANDDTHGYDQSSRYGPNYDCSSLLGTALHEAGFNVSPYSWTGNLRQQLLKEGFVEIDVNAERKRGDIFLSEGHHTVMCIDADNIVHAAINEKGTITGGKSGDQTGTEICTRTFYVPSYKWDYHFRVKEELTETKPSTNIIAGSVVTLNNTKCYNAESSREHYGVKTGIFYLWSDEVINGRIRITNRVERVGVKGQVTCWVNVKDIGFETTQKQPEYSKEVKCAKSAENFDRFLANTYKVTADFLNVRDGAGTVNKILTAVPKNTEVKCYGYYTLVGTTIWLLCDFVYKGVKYTGFLSMKYLKQ